MNRHRFRLERRKRQKGDTAKLAAQLAPLEEQDRAIPTQHNEGRGLRHAVAHQEPGAIVVQRERSISAEELSEPKDSAVLEPVVIVIVCLALAYIGFIAWQISLSP